MEIHESANLGSIMLGDEDANEENRVSAVESKREVTEPSVVLHSLLERYPNHPQQRRASRHWEAQEGQWQQRCSGKGACRSSHAHLIPAIRGSNIISWSTLLSMVEKLHQVEFRGAATYFCLAPCPGCASGPAAFRRCNSGTSVLKKIHATEVSTTVTARMSNPDATPSGPLVSSGCVHIRCKNRRPKMEKPITGAE